MFVFFRKFFTPKEQDLRQKVNSIIREYALKNGGCYALAWNRVYKEFNKRNHCYIKARARHKKTRPLDIVESLGALSLLVIVAKEILK